MKTSYYTIRQKAGSREVCLLDPPKWFCLLTQQRTCSSGMEATICTPKIGFVRSESTVAGRKYWLLDLLVHKLSCIYGNIRFSTLIYTFKPILSENNY